MCNAVFAQTSSLSIEKTIASTPVVAGTNASYTLSVSTEGPDPAQTVALSDTLPPGTTFVSLSVPAGWTCTTPAVGSGGTIDCTRPTFAPGTDAFTLVVAFDPALANGSTVSNTATITHTTSDPDTNDNAATLPVLVESNSNLGVSKSAGPNPAPIGGAVAFQINYSASGPSHAANVTITDALPAGILFTSINAPGWTCTTPAAGANGTVTCTRPSLAAGSSGTIDIAATVDAAVTAGTLITNTATITGDVVDPISANDAASASVTAQHITNLGITKNAAPDPAPIGGTLTYTIGVTSTGPSAAPNVTMTDALPAGTTFASVTAPGWSCTTPAVGANGTVTCVNPSMAAGSSGAITLIVTVDPSVAAGTIIANTATIGGAVIDGTGANDTASASVTARHISNLAITKSAAPNPVAAGAALTYTIGVSASGPSAAPGVTLTDVIPAGTTFTSLAAPAGWVCTTPAAGAAGTVTCSRPSLPPGPAGTFTLVVTTGAALPAGTSISNTATIAGSVVESTSDNSAGAAVTTTVVSDIGVTKTAPATIFAGNTMSYTVAWSASGPSQAANVTIVDALPAATTFASISAPGFSCATPAAGGTGTVTCSAATLAAGSGTITIGVTILQGAAPGTLISNTVTASSAAGDSNPANNTSTATTTVNPPLVSGIKTATTAAQVIEGSAVVYTIVLTNSGASAQNDNPGDELVDVLPPSLALISATATSGTATADVGSNTVRWNGSIAQGGSVTVTINATIRAGAGGTTVSNQATIHFDGDGNGTNESTTFTSSPAGGPTVFAVLAPAIPTLSPALMLLLAGILGVAAWRVIPR